MSDNATNIKGLLAKLKRMEYEKPKPNYSKPWHRFTLRKPKDKK